MPDCLGTFSTTLCQISALIMKEAVGEHVYDNTIFLKWGILNVPFCSMFVYVPFHFSLIMTLVGPCLDNIFMVLLISALATIGVTKPSFLDSGSPRGGRSRGGGGGGCAYVCMVCYH